MGVLSSSPTKPTPHASRSFAGSNRPCEGGGRDFGGEGQVGRRRGGREGGVYRSRERGSGRAGLVGNPGGIVVKKEIVMRERRRTCASGIALCFASTGMTPPRAKRFGPALLARSCARSWLRREPVASAATGGRPGWARKDRDIPARENTTFPRDVTDAEAMAPACLQSRDEPRRRAVRAWCRARRSSRAKNRRAFVRGARVTRVPGRRLADHDRAFPEPPLTHFSRFLIPARDESRGGPGDHDRDFRPGPRNDELKTPRFRGRLKISGIL